MSMTLKVDKLDLIKSLKPLYNPSVKAPVLVDVPPLNFLMVDGQGNPNTSQDFRDAMMVLYGVVYTLKFSLKKVIGRDWRIMPLQGLWWMENMAEFNPERKDDWLWTVMIAQPDFITPEQVKAAAGVLRGKKDPPGLSKLRYERFHEGPAAQIMYLGPFAEEGPTIQRLHRFITDSGHKLCGKHHEIYLSDPRRTPPEKLKTIIRQPFK